MNDPINCDLSSRGQLTAWIKNKIKTPSNLRIIITALQFPTFQPGKINPKPTDPNAQYP
jgi:hypothetical protein